MQTIADKFDANFPGFKMPKADHADLASMPIDSTCGEDCVKAIEAASVYAEMLRSAHGPYSEQHILPIARSAKELCLTYICG